MQEHISELLRRPVFSVRRVFPGHSGALDVLEKIWGRSLTIITEVELFIFFLPLVREGLCV